MKGLSNFGGCLICLLITTAAWSQNKSNVENHVIMDSTDTSGLLVCKLTGAELQKRKAALQKEIFTEVEGSEEVENGYVFHFRDEGNFIEKLADFLLAEKKCCPFFQFDLSIKANNAGISLKVSGPPEAKAMIRSLVEN